MCDKQGVCMSWELLQPLPLPARSVYPPYKHPDRQQLKTDK